jgi:threonine dehydratase
VIAGQGTCGLEIAEDANARGITDATVIVCCGGGGLTAGIALALEADAPTLRVRTAEPEGFDDVARSLMSGQIERNSSQSGNICDAIITPQPGDITWPILKRLCGPGLVISEDDALEAMAQAFLRLKLVAEPGGAAALAAALYRKDQIEGDDVIVTLSGGNVDPAMFARALGHR